MGRHIVVLAELLVCFKFWILLVLLFSNQVQAYVTVRLANGVGLHEGTVEITTDLYNWMTICGSDNFDINDVIVICRTLRYPGANAAIYDTSNSDFAAEQYPMSTLAFLCTGRESGLNDCGTFQTSCINGATAGAICYSNDSGYLGCYVDNSSGRVLTGPWVNERAMTISRCIGFCMSNNFRYAGLEYGTYCYCGYDTDLYDRYGQLTDSACQTTCGGERNSCGGYGNIAVFQVREDPGVTSSQPFTPVMTPRPSPGRTTHRGSGHGVTATPDVSRAQASTPTMTVRMSAKETENFITRPSGIAVVIVLSVLTILIILTVVCLLKRRSSSYDQPRKTSTRPYEEISLRGDEPIPETTPNHYIEEENVPASEPLVVAQPDHTYEQAELFSPGEQEASDLYYSVPDEGILDSQEPVKSSALDDLYAKPKKEKSTGATKYHDNYETIDENFQFASNSNDHVDDDHNHGIEDDIDGQQIKTGCSKLPNGGDVVTNLEDMYAKPVKKHRKVAKEDSFDETCMVENELYTSTDS